MARTAAPTIAHRLQYGLFLAVEWLASGLSWRAAWTLGRAVGYLYYVADARHRRVVRENLRSSDLGLDEAQIQAISKACFTHFGALLFSTLRLLGTNPGEIARITRIEGREHIEAAFAEGKGIIGVTGHFGNWELLGLALSVGGWKMAVIGRELDNPLLEARLRKFRTFYGNSVIAKDGAVRNAIKGLRDGQLIAFLLDQDALASGVFVKFLGRWASTYSTAGVLAVRYDLPILAVSSRVDADGVLTMTASPPFHAPQTGDPARDAWMATQRMTTWIEAQVRSNPTQWFWMHRRFKTQPGPGEPPLPPEEWLAAARAEEPQPCSGRT